MQKLTQTAVLSFSFRFFLFQFSLLLCLIQAPLSLKSQDFDRYVPLQCTGMIPNELLGRSSERFAEQRAQLEENTNKQDRKSQENFLLQSNFAIDDLLLSGKALFNDPLSEYVTRIKDYLLRDLPKIRDQIRIFVVKSSSANAFATNQGVVLVNIGLLARLKNEAELAFILCHEFQHFIHSHPINQYVNTQNLKNNRRFFNDEAIEEFLLAKSRYSRELEMEADQLGMELFLSTSYTLDAVNSVFDLLRYAYLPIAQMPWEATGFESQNLQFPASYFRDSLDAISAEEDYDDTRQSHPNIGTRRDTAMQMLKGKNNDGRSAYIFGEESFTMVRQLAQFDLCQIYLDQRQYERAIYLTYILRKSVPKSFYLDKIVVQSLYGLARHRNDRNFYDVHRDYEEIEGESQQLYYFMEQLEKEELNVLALRAAWLLAQAHPEDNELQAIADDLMDDFFIHHREIAETMQDQPAPPGFFDQFNRFEDSLSSTDNYYQHAFSDLFQNPEFALAYSEALNTGTRTNPEVYVSPRKRRRMRKKELLDGKALGLEKVVFVAPIYKQIDERKKVPIEYIASEKAWENFVGMIEETASIAGLEQDLLSNRQLKATDIERFNDQVIMEKWINDFMSGENETKLVNVYADEAMAIAEKYGTDHFAITGALILTQKKNPFYTVALVTAGVYIVTLPYVIYKLVKPKRAMVYLNLVFNVAENEVALGQTQVMRLTPRKSLLKSKLYDSMHQMKAK